MFPILFVFVFLQRHYFANKMSHCPTDGMFVAMTCGQAEAKTIWCYFFGGMLLVVFCCSRSSLLLSFFLSFLSVVVLLTESNNNVNVTCKHHHCMSMFDTHVCRKKHVGNILVF